jgi:Cu(I)/Ag(I) efflux system membrane fusion protein
MSHLLAIQSQLKKINYLTTKISEAGELKVQRIYFKPLSENIVEVASSFGDLDEPLYAQFCPMTDNNKGGTWLSFQEKIQNPYIGDAMLTCGRITTTLH